MPSFILIHPTVWPQHTNVIDGTDRQDMQDRQARQRTDSIGRTVLQMVAQKRFCAVFSAIVLHSNVLTYRQILQMTPGFV